MCGIAALFSRKQIDQPKLASAIRALRHRGPDHEGFWRNSSNTIGLGHSRLSIIDLQTGNQPLFNEDKSIALVVNGEFYDFERIRKDLENRGHRFSTSSDSEIAIHLYEEYGLDFVHHLRGEFAFLLWDERQSRLLAVRDRFGIKPLYWAEWDQTLGFASEVKAIFAAGLPAAWSESGIGQYFSGLFDAMLPTQALFENVRQVAPGTMLVIERRSDGFAIKENSYWDLNYAPESKLNVNISIQEAAEELREKLKEAVRLRLRADVPVGTYLSGGIDSCSILGFAASLTDLKIDAFTIGFDLKQYDETLVARRMAEKAGARLNVIPVSQKDIGDNFFEAVYHNEIPLMNGHAVAKFLLSKAVREKGIKVILTGEGSDEVFAGYEQFRYVKDGIQYDPNALAKMDSIFGGVCAPHGESISTRVIEEKLKYVPHWLGRSACVAHKFHELCRDSNALYEKVGDTYQTLFDTLPFESQLKNQHPLNQSQYLWNKTVLPNYIVSVLGDRMEMAHSVEGRVPFLDHVLFEWTRTLPPSAKIKGETEKHILREAAKPILTEEVYGRRKHGFLAPPPSLDPEGRFFEMIQETFRGPALQSIPFLDQEKVLDLLQRSTQMSFADKVAYDLPIMGILSLCALQQRFRLN